MPEARRGLMQRFEAYRPPKAALGWCCILSVVATITIGFVWGGWVTEGTATEMSNRAAEGASAKLAAAICAAQFDNDPAATVQRAALNKLDTWQRADFITKGGWARLPGMKDSVAGAADLCAERVALPTEKTAGTSG
jgi:hypothetical protein